ncbi:MAG: DNA/RNA nuclease SfsA [Clostridia bacterium]|nr:DNA/RNA nuclease SfsA [Clostridia bacterium]
MRYSSTIKGKFISRPNRFIANVEIDGQATVVHVKNTGRCKELLTEGATVILAEGKNPLRKTKYDLIAVYKGDMLVNMDSQVPNDVVYEWLLESNLFSKNALIKREHTYGKSRFDIYVEDGKRRAFIEVKGVTLENDGVASFPDAPTERGVKHLLHLIECQNDGYEAYIFFVIQMKGVYAFVPNDKTHKEFGDALRLCKQRGVSILCYDSIVTEDSIKISDPVSILI